MVFPSQVTINYNAKEFSGLICSILQPLMKISFPDPISCSLIWISYKMFFSMFKDILFALSHYTITVSSEFTVSINMGKSLPEKKKNHQQTIWQKVWVRQGQGHLHMIGKVVDLNLSLVERHFSPLKFHGWHRKTIEHTYATSSFVHHFKSIGEFKQELQSQIAQFGSKFAIVLSHVT